MDDNSDVTELWKTNDVANQTKDLGMWFTEAKRLLSSTLPSGSARKPCETPLPSIVEFNKELSADITGDIGKPGEQVTKLGQFVDLVKGCRVDLIGSGRP